MKKLALILLGFGLLAFAGCESGLSSFDLYHDEPLPPMAAADRVTLRSPSGRVLPVTEITDPERVVHLVEFVNSVPNKWNVPNEGTPPVGRIYFTFHKGRQVIGNFYVGTVMGKKGTTNFFGRNTNNNFSRVATEPEIRALSELAGFDIWEIVKPAPGTAPEAAKK